MQPNNGIHPEPQAAPPYMADVANASYYGQHNGFEIQRPSNTYHPERGGNAPPRGSPAMKERDIIS